ncbi:MAG: mechanosensitive ion channel protein MscS [delta proteobacterium MLS_D]|jgi:moderate conductance mechanosensitive channel|nr:MAG: mechanosensitive ion channel protein MscS [delta proteobacterium MLS_D]
MEHLMTKDFWENLLSGVTNWGVNEIPGILIMAVGLVIALRVTYFAVSRFQKLLIQNARKKEKTDALEFERRILTLTGIILGAVRIVLYTLFAIMLLSSFNINIAPLLAGVGIVGLAVGFGAQELVRDYISGFFMLLEDQVRMGDVAIINGTAGLVEKIELRTISLRDFNGTVHIFQNGKIDTLANMTKGWSAMVFDIGVAYKENVDQVMEIMKQVGDELRESPDFGPDIIEPIEVFGLDRFGDSALVIKARLKTRPLMQWIVGREYRRRLKMAFDSHNIEIPFPHTTIYWGKEIDPLELNVKEVKMS